MAPALLDLGLRATFYVPTRSSLLNHTHHWAALAADGHELGNHTCFHPCRNDDDKHADWLDRGLDLRDYTPRRWREEIGLANWCLQQIDGQTVRSFGNTCHNTTFGPQERNLRIADYAADMVCACRGPCTGAHVSPDEVNLMELGTAGVDHTAIDDILPLLDRAAQAGGWLILTMHAVGPADHRLFIDETVHTALIQRLSDTPACWCAPVRDIAMHSSSPR